MRKFGYEPAPLVLAFVLGPMLENNLRKSLILSQGDFTFFIERPSERPHFPSMSGPHLRHEILQFWHSVFDSPWANGMKLVDEYICSTTIE